MEEEEEVKFIICMSVADGNPSSYPDNVLNNCAECSRAIYHRPHTPEPSKKICMYCLLKNHEPALQADSVCITPKTAEELRLRGIPESMIQALLRKDGMS